VNAEVTTTTATLDEAELREAISLVHQRVLPDDLDYWVGQYATVGHRDAFLWKWCLEGVSLTSLPCVDPKLRDTNNETKVLGVMFDVLLDAMRRVPDASLRAKIQSEK